MINPIKRLAVMRPILMFLGIHALLLSSIDSLYPEVVDLFHHPLIHLSRKQT
jgi:hypothetical protein